MLNSIIKMEPEKSFQIFKQTMLNKLKQNSIIYHSIQNLSSELAKSIAMLKQIENELPNMEKYEVSYLDDIDNQYQNLISPEMYQKISSYYNKYKSKTYSSKYKIDSKIHHMLMSIGKYLEKMNYDLESMRSRKLELENRYYSLASSLSKRMNDYLALLSKTLRKMAIKLGILGTSLFYGLSFMSAYSPELLTWLKFVFLFNRLNDIMLITSYAISPNRKKEIISLKNRIMEALGLYRDKDYSTYIKFVYKLYDILNAIMSFIKNLDTYLRGSRSWKEFYESLEKHMLATTGISYKWLVDVVSVDLVAVDEFLTSLSNHEELNTYRYRIRLPLNNVNKLKQHYGDNVRVDGGWISFTITYLGGRYYLPDNPLDANFILDVSGFEGSLENKADFVMASILLADEMILDSVHTTYLRSGRGIMSIDLRQLKWLVYKDKSWLVRLIDRILGRDKKYLTPETIGDRLYESYTMLHKVNRS
jgi:hypothetical protein